MSHCLYIDIYCYCCTLVNKLDLSCKTCLFLFVFLPNLYTIFSCFRNIFILRDFESRFFHSDCSDGQCNRYRRNVSQQNTSIALKIICFRKRYGWSKMFFLSFRLIFQSFMKFKRIIIGLTENVYGMAKKSCRKYRLERYRIMLKLN